MVTFSSVQTNNFNQAVCADLYNASGAKIASDPCNGTSAPVSIPTTGSYTFVVHDGDYGNSRQTGSYNANWQFNEGCPTCILSPPSLGFGPQLVGTISAPKIATLTNTGLVESLTITNIATNANFRETNNCGALLRPAVLARST